MFTFLPLTLAYMPAAVLQSPSNTLKIFLSTFASIEVSKWLIFERMLFNLSSSALDCITIVPWPAGGTIFSHSKTSDILFSIDKDNKPAFAKIIESYWFSSNFLILVSMFPLINLKFRSGLKCFNWNSLLNEEVPITEFILILSSVKFSWLITIYCG